MRLKNVGYAVSDVGRSNLHTPTVAEVNHTILAPLPAVSTARLLESVWNDTVLNTSTDVNVPAHTVNTASANLEVGTLIDLSFPAVA